MKLYRCELCGRVFNQKTPHKCYGGCFRKHSLIFTEFEDVDNEYIKRVISDVKENNFPNIPQGSLILKDHINCNCEYWINWKSARVDAAIVAMQGIVANTHERDYRMHEPFPNGGWRKSFPSEIAEYAVALADALIAELKRAETNETR